MATLDSIRDRALNTSGAGALRAVETQDDFLGGALGAGTTAPEDSAWQLRELVAAGISVLEGRRSKALVPLAESPWELCLASAGNNLELSVYRTGPMPEVRALDVAVPAIEFAAYARRRLATALVGAPLGLEDELVSLVGRLEDAARFPAPSAPRVGPLQVRWGQEVTEQTISVGFSFVVGGVCGSERGPLRADLHALLLRGTLELLVRGQRAPYTQGFPVLQLERLLSLCRPMLEAAAARRPMHVRLGTGSASLGFRVDAQGRLAITMTPSDGPSVTLAAIEPSDFVVPIARASLAMARELVRCDRARGRNLRLRSLRSEARAVLRAVRLAQTEECKLNPSPDLYRSAVQAPSEEPTAPLYFAGAGRHRYQPRWRAEIEGIDLQGTLLCGERLVVTGARETCALDRRTGAVLWTKNLPRAAAAAVSGHLLRLTPRGEVELRDSSDGGVLWSSRVAPRVGSPGHALSVQQAGLPRLVVLAEAERRLVALDVATGEPRWRYQARMSGAFRLRRAGRLLLVVSGDCTVSALDVATGELVWRFAGPAPFTFTPTVHKETVLALSSAGAKGRARLFAIDALTGEHRWSRELEGSAASLPAGTGELATVVLSSGDGLALRGFGLANGEECWNIPLASANSHGGRPVALNVVDDLLLANLPVGRVVALDGNTGKIRWSRLSATSRGAEAAPRRMDVQARGGALFVPQSSVAVLRPEDGTPAALLEQCDLVPDLLRIDEECAVYVAEESGHLGCWELAARLRVVRGGA